MIDFDYVKARDVSDAVAELPRTRLRNSSPAAPISSI